MTNSYEVGDRVWVKFRGQWGRVLSWHCLMDLPPVYTIRLDCGVPCNTSGRGLSRRSPSALCPPRLRLIVDNTPSLPPCDVEI